MFKFKKRSVINFAIVLALLLSLSAAISPLRKFPLNILKSPFSLATLLKREISGIVFYHRNFIQNEKLKKGIDLLRYKLNVLSEVYLENARLKNLLSFKGKSHYKLIAARVIGRSPDNWSSVIIIDKGTYQGIKNGFAVITYLGLIGRVVEVAESTSKIMLINDSDMSVSCAVQRSRQEGLVSGTLGSVLMMKYLPRDADIKASDIIITSGLTSIYPKGLLVGKVIEVGIEFSNLSRYAIIKPAVNLSNLEEVLVIIP